MTVFRCAAATRCRPHEHCRNSGDRSRRLAARRGRPRATRYPAVATQAADRMSSGAEPGRESSSRATNGTTRYYGSPLRTRRGETRNICGCFPSSAKGWAATGEARREIGCKRPHEAGGLTLSRVCAIAYASIRRRHDHTSRMERVREHVASASWIASSRPTGADRSARRWRHS